MVIEERLRRYRSSKPQDSMTRTVHAALHSTLRAITSAREARITLERGLVISVGSASGWNEGPGTAVCNPTSVSAARMPGALEVSFPGSGDLSVPAIPSHLPVHSSDLVKSNLLLDPKVTIPYLPTQEALQSKLQLLPPQQQLQVHLQLLNQQQMSGQPAILGGHIPQNCLVPATNANVPDALKSQFPDLKHVPQTEQVQFMAVDKVSRKTKEGSQKPVISSGNDLMTTHVVDSSSFAIPSTGGLIVPQPGSLSTAANNQKTNPASNFTINNITSVVPSAAVIPRVNVTGGSSANIPSITNIAGTSISSGLIHTPAVANIAGVTNASGLPNFAAPANISGISNVGGIANFIGVPGVMTGVADATNEMSNAANLPVMTSGIVTPGLNGTVPPQAMSAAGQLAVPHVSNSIILRYS